MLYDGALPLVRNFKVHNGSDGTSKLQPRIFTFSPDPPFLEVVLGVDPVVVLVEDEEVVVLEKNSVLRDDSVLEVVVVVVVDEVVVVVVVVEVDEDSELSDEMLGELEDELDAVVVLVEDQEEAVELVVLSVWLIKVVDISDSVVSEVTSTPPPFLI